MLKKPGLTLLFASIILFLLMYYRSIAKIDWFDMLALYPQNGIISPLELISFFLISIALYIIFFNQTIQQSWWRWARFALIVPFALIILLLPMYQSGGGFISFGGTTELVILWGVLFGIASFIYPLWQRWYLKTGVLEVQ